MTQGELGLLVDTGRKHWTKDQLKALLDLMKAHGFTHFQWHFSDFLGFRVALASYPEVASEDHLTLDEMREIIAYAKALEIEIVPELDTPGHMTPVLAKYPQWGVKLQDDEGHLTPSDNALDITNPRAKEAVFEMLTELLDLFKDSQYFHLGADEFIWFSDVHKFPDLMASSQALVGEKASGLESYVAYTNELIDFIRAHGKTPRVWNDGFYRSDVVSQIDLSKDVEICYWTKWDKAMAPLDTWVDKGYKLVNFNDNYLYYVLGEHASYTYPTVDKLADFAPNKFSGEQLLASEHQDQLLGTYLAVWSDKPEAKTVDEILADIAPLMAKLGH